MKVGDGVVGIAGVLMVGISRAMVDSRFGCSSSSRFQVLNDGLEFEFVFESII